MTLAKAETKTKRLNVAKTTKARVESVIARSNVFKKNFSKKKKLALLGEHYEVSVNRLDESLISAFSE